MTQHADTRIARQDPLEFFIGVRRSIGYDDETGMQRVANADTTAVMDRHPGGAARCIEQRVEDWPIGDGITAVAHAFRFAIWRRDRPGVEVIAADDNRRADSS